MGSGVPWGLLEVVAAGCGPVVKLWAPSEPQQAIKINEGTPVYGVGFSHNNRVLVVAGEKGQVSLYSSKGAAVNKGCDPVGLVPRTPQEDADSITCIKFAPDDTCLVGGCRNGLVHVWSLKDEGTITMDAQIGGSITSVAVSTGFARPMMAAASSSGQVVLSEYPSGKKFRTLLPRGPRAGCLGFASTLLCGGKGSGQLLVWDVSNIQQGAQEYNVHRALVTGCIFSPTNDSLLVSCGGDGLLVCTDRRTGQVAWESQLRQPLCSLSMRWDGSQVAVGTGTGRVLVHDLRRIGTTLAAQQFSDELPVTALSWQYAPVPTKSHKKSSHGSAAATASVGPASSGSAAPSSRTQAAPSSAAPGSVSSAAVGLGGRAAAAAAAGGSAAAAAAGVPSARGGTKLAAAAATQQPQRAPLIVPGFDNGTPHSGTSSADADYGLHVMSPMRAFSPLDSDVNSAGPAAAAAAATAAATKPGAALHTPDAGLAAATPADSSVSAAGYNGPAMFTPGLPYMGNLGAAETTPFGVPAADATPISRLADKTGLAAAAASAANGRAPAAASSAATDSRSIPRSPRGSAGGAAPVAVPTKSAAATAAGSRGSDSAAAASKGSRSPRAAGVKSSSGAAAGSAAAAPAGVGSHRRKPSDSTAAVPVAAGSRSRPSTAPDSSNVPDNAAGGRAAAAANGMVGTGPSGRMVESAGGAGTAAAAVNTGGAAAAGQLHVGSSQLAAAIAGAATAGGAGSSSMGGSSTVPAAAGGGVMGVTGSALREDVFKAYIDEHMQALQASVTKMHVDLHRRFEDQQADFAAVVNSLAARQDQLAEAVTQLAEAVHNLSASKQQQQQQHPMSGVSIIPWI